MSDVNSTGIQISCRRKTRLQAYSITDILKDKKTLKCWRIQYFSWECPQGIIPSDRLTSSPGEKGLWKKPWPPGLSTSPGGSLQTDTGFVTDHDFISIHKKVWSYNCNTGSLICGEFREETFALLKTVVRSFLSYKFWVRSCTFLPPPFPEYSCILVLPWLSWRM